MVGLVGEMPRRSLGALAVPPLVGFHIQLAHLLRDLTPRETAALALIGKFPAQEVRSNLQRLKGLIETGRVTDKSYAVPGKYR